MKAGRCLILMKGTGGSLSDSPNASPWAIHRRLVPRCHGVSGLVGLVGETLRVRVLSKSGNSFRCKQHVTAPRNRGSVNLEHSIPADPDPRSRRRRTATPRTTSTSRPLLPAHTHNMASLPILSQTARTAASATKSLTTSMRALSLAARPAALPALQTRCLSQAALATSKTALSAGAVAPAVQSGVAVFQKVQTRGMKVRSAIKKRCEHCKVRRMRSGEPSCLAGGIR